MTNFPCKCGHDYSHHDMVTEFINKDNFCRDCDLTFYDQRGISSSWHKYQADNLKYLEQLSEFRD